MLSAAQRSTHGLLSGEAEVRRDGGTGDTEAQVYVGPWTGGSQQLSWNSSQRHIWLRPSTHSLIGQASLDVLGAVTELEMQSRSV